MRHLRILMATLAVMFMVNGVHAQPPNTPTNRPTEEFTGTAYDIDYASDQTQVLIRPAGAPEGPNLVGFIKFDAIQDVLQTSLVASRMVQVTHYRQNIIRAVLIQTPTICSEDGCVLEVDCSDFECTAVITGESARVKVPNRRALGILLTAINDGRRVEELIVNQQREITRVKVNVPTTPERH